MQEALDDFEQQLESGDLGLPAPPQTPLGDEAGGVDDVDADD